ncbi:hypothetical protein RG601_04830 [Enterococcus sp. FR169]|uniref:hypothetical protein n=1 Tax=Enterococcus sp. FR169 TaxID=2923505 RepID=UPI00280CE60F|nr:hypothetical protein [Enterococcus sp. FR169]MDQ8644360.1 hypothetical protein [Enterococcus sp. FR169]
MSRLFQEEVINQLNICIVELKRQKENLENEKRELENSIESTKRELESIKRELESRYINHLEKLENLSDTKRISKKKIEFRYVVILATIIIVILICLTYLFGNSYFLDFFKNIIAPS